MIYLYHRYIHGSLSCNTSNPRLHYFLLVYIVFANFFLSLFLLLFRHRYRCVFHYDRIFRTTARSLQTTVERKLSHICRGHASIDTLISSTAEFSFPSHMEIRSNRLVIRVLLISTRRFNFHVR